ncbi:GntR family transcriptional regulator [Parerythrobacter jejuensis]|uniref:FCD domain-containing protein n=1 Tax=Parerythrobacter jejuensis TaxID=795812 RepID=A0A845AXD9_9SPHN|nr:GntR family transcriptional regulator [Parerythrobacter jejuensis]MXP31428.1 FCD domain-containing protein [Parerythrobacter jejuensis]
MSRASDTAYEKIRGFVLGGEAQPGEQLTEERLADIAGVSRTPVREAVRRLEGEMLLVRSASKRIFVADWSHDDIDEMFTLRMMLEGHAAERAARHISSDALDQLAAINARLAEAVAKRPPDITDFLDANREFHDVIIEAARSPRLAQVLAMLVEQPVVRRTARQYTFEQLDQSARDHDELIAAFRARDEGWAQAVMSSHLRRAFHAFSQAAEGVANDDDIEAAE